MENQIEKLFSDAHRRSYDRGKAEGKAEGEVKGEAKALMMILKRRGMAITDEQQRRIVSCTDVATLDSWLARALVAEADEIFTWLRRDPMSLQAAPDPGELRRSGQAGQTRIQPSFGSLTVAGGCSCR
jgi:hypothetical protein